jgi:hypothetical protein
MCLCISLCMSLITIVLNCKSHEGASRGGRGDRIIFQKNGKTSSRMSEPVTEKKVRHGCGHPCDAEDRSHPVMVISPNRPSGRKDRLLCKGLWKHPLPRQRGSMKHSLD